MHRYMLTDILLELSLFELLFTSGTVNVFKLIYVKTDS
jgi:hypothetical protein